MKLKKIFSLLENRTRLTIIFVILFLLGVAFSEYLIAALFSIIFIVVAGLSKIYHRFFKSSLGIDLVFFTTAVTAVAYQNFLLSFFVGWLGLIIADTLGTRFSHTSLITLIGLTIIILAGGFVSGLPVLIALILLLIVFNLAAGISYLVMGSPPGKVMLFVLSHFLFNLFLILSFAEELIKIMR
jgi:hypothetical protein